MKKISILISILMLTLILCSCRQTDLYEKDTVIPGYKWNSNFAVTGSFAVTDTSAAYNIYIVLRHTDAYAYNNIWLNVGRRAPGDSMAYEKVNLVLGNDAQGWAGSGLNDIWEVRKIYLHVSSFKKTGEYGYSISQIMRDDPLPHVMSAGLRLEKAP